MRPPSIADSLERLGAQDVDITAAVYARLFAARPEAEALFVPNDPRDARGAMLAQVLTLLLALEAGEPYAASTLRSEVMRHGTDFDTDPNLFGGFFAVVAETVREQSGAVWTADDEVAWSAILARTAALTG